MDKAQPAVWMRWMEVNLRIKPVKAEWIKVGFQKR